MGKNESVNFMTHILSDNKPLVISTSEIAQVFHVHFPTAHEILIFLSYQVISTSLKPCSIAYYHQSEFCVGFVTDCDGFLV